MLVRPDPPARRRLLAELSADALLRPAQVNAASPGGSDPAALSKIVGAVEGRSWL